MAIPVAVQRVTVRTTKAAGDYLAEFGKFLVFSSRALSIAVTQIVFRLRYRRQVLHFVSDIVVGAGAYVVGGGMVFVIAAMALFVGGTVGVQVFNGLQSLGAEQYTGLVGAYVNTRELTPIIAAIALAAQVGSSFTSEIGAMRISEEVDALEVMAVPPMAYLVATRLVAAVLAIVPLYSIAMFFSFFATRFMTVELFGMSPGLYDHYFHLYLPPIDVFYSVIKILVFSVMIVLIHTYYGFNASGGPAGVGRAVGRAIRTSIVWIVLVNLLLSYVFWGVTSTVSLVG